MINPIFGILFSVFVQTILTIAGIEVIDLILHDKFYQREFAVALVVVVAILIGDLIMLSIFRNKK